MKTVLAVAADPLELRWIPERGRDVCFLKVARGPGPRLARAAAESVGEAADAVLSTGLCGAIDPRLSVGDIVVASRVNGLEAALPVCRRPHRVGELISVDRVASSAEEKRRLAASGAVAVEMEAAAVLAFARERRIPFYCVRVVSDTADEGFALDLNRARRADGSFDRLRIAGQALRRPVSGLRELWKLSRRAVLAARALGDFVADCHF